MESSVSRIYQKMVGSDGCGYCNKPEVGGWALSGVVFTCCYAMCVQWDLNGLDALACKSRLSGL